MISVASSAMLYESAGKLSDARFDLSPAFVIDFIALLTDADIVVIRGLDMRCRDERDTMLIEIAYNGRADVLVTRDLDLQDARTRDDFAKRECVVLNVTAFLARHRAAHYEDDVDREMPSDSESSDAD